MGCGTTFRGGSSEDDCEFMGEGPISIMSPFRFRRLFTLSLAAIGICISFIGKLRCSGGGTCPNWAAAAAAATIQQS